MDHFIDIAKKQFPNIKMYPVANYHSIDNFVQHESCETNDVQILYDGEVGSQDIGHAICINYQASSQNVLVYDSQMSEKLEPKQEEIIRKLYPFKKGIVFKKPKTTQGLIHTDPIFTIMYATMLLLNTDPSKNDLKLNTVFGEEALYMRLHILDMFANEKLSLMKNEHKIRTMISNITAPSCLNSRVKE